MVGRVYSATSAFLTPGASTERAPPPGSATATVNGEASSVTKVKYCFLFGLPVRKGCRNPVLTLVASSLLLFIGNLFCSFYFDFCLLLISCNQYSVSLLRPCKRPSDLYFFHPWRARLSYFLIHLNNRYSTLRCNLLVVISDRTWRLSVPRGICRSSMKSKTGKNEIPKCHPQ